MRSWRGEGEPGVAAGVVDDFGDLVFGESVVASDLHSETEDVVMPISGSSSPNLPSRKLSSETAPGSSSRQTWRPCYAHLSCQTLNAATSAQTPPWLVPGVGRRCCRTARRAVGALTECLSRVRPRRQERVQHTHLPIVPSPRLPRRHESDRPRCDAHRQRRGVRPHVDRITRPRQSHKDTVEPGPHRHLRLRAPRQ